MKLDTAQSHQTTMDYRLRGNDIGTSLVRESLMFGGSDFDQQIRNFNLMTMV